YPETRHSLYLVRLHLYWEKEASIRATIYQNSFLTIAATSTSDGNGGCFVHVKTPLKEWVDKNVDSHSFRVIIRPKPAYHSMIWNAALNQRGWTIQEIALSSRTVHFTEGQWFWQSRERFDSE
ncbi:uncharacterized protein A1O9_08615, partial [Exophiala aquamarina CBS 119918]